MMEVAVVGGGIAGLAAAHRLRRHGGPDLRITVYEAGPAVGGKLRTGRLAGQPVEYGAEAFLTRDPLTGGDSAALDLARAVGLGDALCHPVTARAAIAVDGALHPVPAGTLVGVPGDLAALPPLATARPEPPPAAGAPPLLGPHEDVAVGALVRDRLGDQVVDRLVAPMLGGVYAGDADALSLAATMPALARACRGAPTLTGAVRAALAALPRPAGAPVFTAVAGGLGRFAAAVAAASGATVHTGQVVRALHPAGDGWRLTLGATRDPVHVTADAVVLAVPARPAARLLASAAEPAADLVGQLDYASVALVTFALPAGTALPELSGLLAPDGLVKAATFVSRKWGRPAHTPVLLRASAGRYREEAALQVDDDTLAAAALAAVGDLLGAALPAPLASHVQRWGGALPQYRPGHLDRVAAARAALGPGLALAGAACDGIGIPACVASGRRAADEIWQHLTSRRHRDR
nr:protoporphyrinogen oxidase [Pilimelia terevasa]